MFFAERSNTCAPILTLSSPLVPQTAEGLLESPGQHRIWPESVTKAIKELPPTLRQWFLPCDSPSPLELGPGILGFPPLNPADNLGMEKSC
jgi:hypothetical protein